MTDLIKTDVKMTSLDISEITGKQHKHVLADIRKEIEELGEEIGQPIFRPSSYTNTQNKEQPCYTFGKDGAMQLALKYDAKTRYKVIKRIEELENTQSNYQLPGNYKEALIQLVEKVEQNEKLALENQQQKQQIGELKPKADYTDRILQNKGLVTISQIAKDYGMSGQALNKLLHKLKIQYKQSEQWLLYADYHDKGYTHSKTVDITKKDGSKDVKLSTKWTQKGRLFLYELLKSEGVLPVIEKEGS